MSAMAHRQTAVLLGGLAQTSRLPLAGRTSTPSATRAPPAPHPPEHPIGRTSTPSATPLLFNTLKQADCWSCWADRQTGHGLVKPTSVTAR